MKKQRDSNDKRLKNLQSLKDHPERINKKGRPPKLLNEVNQDLRNKGYTPVSETQIIEAYELILQLDKNQIKALTEDKTKPYFLTLVARWMDSARGMEMLDRIMDRAFGRVRIRQEMDIKIPDKQIIKIGGQDIEF